MPKYLFTFFLVSSVLFGQITITYSDQVANLALGTEYVVQDDTLATSADIGHPGGGNNWDFSDFVPHLSFTTTSIEKESTPYEEDFPNANYVFYAKETFADKTIESWSYITLQPSQSLIEGLGYKTESQAGVIEAVVTQNPPDIEMVFPVTFNSTWSYNGEETLVTEVGGFPFETTSSIKRTELVDASGIMKMPNGALVEALRIRSDESIDTDPGFGLPIQHTRIISYSYLSKTGEGFYITARDTNASNSGVIMIDAVGWHYISGSSDVERIDPVATDFHLKQNYPNPFSKGSGGNPSTTIEYSIPEGSFVTLKVYNALGKEVATLVNEFQSAGTYRSEFNAVDLPSGTYFVNLRSGSFSETKKMSLLK